MTDAPNWTICRYADMCNEEGTCANGCEVRAMRDADLPWWEQNLRPVAQPSNNSGASESPSSYRARPSDPDLNPVSVKDLSASASPATKEQQ